VPLIDMVMVRQALDGTRTRLVGPNSQGILAPGLAQLGVMATTSARKGPIGIASRSASLTSEIVAQVTRAGLGQSTTVGVGGDPIHGFSMRDCLELFFADPETEGVVLIGEIGGFEEQEAAEFIREAKPTKPIVALIVGAHAPAERRMGHAGALAIGGAAGASAKIAALEQAGVRIAPSAGLVGRAMADALAKTH
jgi:succinyl-CoA synthetase alpha subunit